LDYFLPMRQRLKKFSLFAHSLLPHEADYLLSVEKFGDKQRSELLKQVARNCRLPDTAIAYDEKVDKRKFSHLKNWMQDKLNSIDVDMQFKRLCDLEIKLMTDAITPDEEKELLAHFKNSRAADYNFLKLYETGLRYRHFLQIRMRYDDHKSVSSFLERNHGQYEQSISINVKLHQATGDIIRHFKHGDKESMDWQQWLNKIFFDEAIDGYNRLLAFIRLIFIAYNHRMFEILPDKFEYLDKMFRQGKFYSRRILLNYYSQQLLAHARAGDLEQAAYYGYLSVRFRNSDFLYYSNNLAAVLLRHRKPEDAMQVIKDAMPEAQNTYNFYNKVGHAAYHIMALNELKKYKQAETRATIFFQNYRQQVFDHRRHLFFIAWFQSLLLQNNPKKIIRIIHRHTLMQEEKSQQRKTHYLPYLSWLYHIALYKSGKMSFKNIAELMAKDMERYAPALEQPRWGMVNYLTDIAEKFVPDVWAKVKALMSK
jgi:predicted HTH domain antitoxin